MPHAAEHTAAAGVDDRFGIGLQRSTDSEISGDEEPGVASGLYNRPAGAMSQRIGVVCPVNGRRGADIGG